MALRSVLKTGRLALALAGALLLAACDTDLYTNLDEREANLMVAALIDRGIPASRVVEKSGKMTITVDKDRFAEAVKTLNDAGLPRERFANMGEVFKRDGLVASPVQERAQMIYALSEELSRTVSEIDGVVSARVHVVLPENDPLKRDAAPSSASVFIRYDPSMKLNELLPQIKTLVANGIAGLSYDKVSVTPVAVPTAKLNESASPTPYVSVMGIWVHQESAGRLMWMLLGLAAIAIVAAAALAALLWRNRKPTLKLQPLVPAK
ncbi:type III secretion system inner membrane ring lipoprotein SctJ [Chenggangzhangella methanolivorans]|uniref:Lipoprotein n=1 Tax=Chenggangzhangella methanolivorans TaxID=1437009 RepID=A0A9E6R6T6_9HYPH|nr:type III secretion inner membrane ring lipoprotein SctJ [Chenggangzhangella methanolivorans]QZN98466.1 type III secretion inner membrane ring lipoprotein SctJ [Chenggangzhangella methanolivorans]